MRQEVAEGIEEYHLCPLCLTGDSQWDEIVKHLVRDHTDKEAFEQLGYDPRDFPEDKT